MTQSRLSKLFKSLQQAGLDALALSPGPTLRYLTGMRFDLMERPIVLLLAPPNAAAMALPELETGKLAACPLSVREFTYGDNPATWQSAFHRACQYLRLNGRKIGIELTRLRALELQYLEAAVPKGRFLSAETALETLRIEKNQDEIAAIRQAVKIAQEAFLATLPMITPGITERQIAAELTIQLLRAGSESEFPFSPVIASGPNSASPHATPGDRPVEMGDFVVIDWGANYRGYHSDLCRTIAIGEITIEMQKIYQIVLEANAAGLAACQPGAPAGEIDRATRAVIASAGYGDRFIHRTGHGIGMEPHEPPYLFKENQQPLSPGMTFTVEPGIYLPQQYGVRIEDNVVITPSGVEILSSLNRELITIV